MKLLRLALFPVLCLLPLLLLAAPGAVRKGAVTAELISAQQTIQPGQPFRVALRLTHDEHWHSYWINPGTGYPTTLRWKLPEGFKAGPIQWPVPHVVKDTHGKITGHGYEGTALLFVELTAPATLTPGESVTLRAKADWLMCSEVCMPGVADLELTLKVAAEPPVADMTNARRFNVARDSLPQPLAGWTLAAQRDGATVTARLTPAAGNQERLSDLHIFDSAGLLDFAAPQVVTEESGSYVLKLAVNPEFTGEATRFAGVIVAGGGWGPLAPSHGATFDVPLEKSGQLSAVSSQPNTQVSGSGSQVSAPAAPAAGLAVTLFLALLGGLVLNLMPCVFPVLGIKILGFVNQAGHDRTKVIGHGLIYTLGVLLSFWMLAGAILALRASGQQIGWGAQLQSAGFVFGMAAFLLVFALNLSGLFEIGLAATAVGGKLQMQQGLAGSFFSGILAVLVSTPCSAPFLAPALGAAFSPAFSAGESMLIFTAIALGLSAPYLILSLFPAAVKLLPRPGAWMETFKQLMAFPLYATVGALLWVLAGQTKDNDYALLFILFGLVLIALAGWVYGRYPKAAGRVVAALVVAAGLWLGWPRTESAPATAGGYAVKWEHWSPEAVAAARAAGRTIYVDFTARWCATCQTNKAAVFTSPDVLATLAKQNVLLLKADWTSRDPQITEELARWNRSAVPFNLIYAPGKPDPTILPELLTPGTVVDALAK
jgi:thiol:disulfide interchange protein/DsbC/DsbD-like thiol-disulfide interchange protein